MELIASHLRIGNLFKEKYTNEIIKVLRLEENIIVFDFETEEKWQAQPIDLTEEWLKKLGFKEKESRFIYPKRRFVLGNVSLYSTKQETFIGYIFNYNNNFIIGIKYLHQLQNLYFAICMEELKIS